MITLEKTVTVNRVNHSSFLVDMSAAEFEDFKGEVTLGMLSFTNFEDVEDFDPSEVVTLEDSSED